MKKTIGLGDTELVVHVVKSVYCFLVQIDALSGGFWVGRCGDVRYNRIISINMNTSHSMYSSVRSENSIPK